MRRLHLRVGASCQHCAKLPSRHSPSHKCASTACNCRLGPLAEGSRGFVVRFLLICAFFARRVRVAPLTSPRLAPQSHSPRVDKRNDIDSDNDNNDHENVENQKKTKWGKTNPFNFHFVDVFPDNCLSACPGSARVPRKLLTGVHELLTAPLSTPSRTLPSLSDHAPKCRGSEEEVAGFPMHLRSSNVTRALCADNIWATKHCKSATRCASSLPDPIINRGGKKHFRVERMVEQMH